MSSNNGIQVPATIIGLVEMTREMRSMEETLLQARQDRNERLRRSVEGAWSRMSESRLQVVIGLLRKGVPDYVLKFVAQDADKWQLQDLRCAEVSEEQLIDMIKGMLAAVQA